MSNAFISFMFAAGAAGWIYSKLMRSTGGNAKSAATAAGILGVIGFFVFWLILNTVVPS